MQRFHVQRAIELLTIGLRLRAAKSVLLPLIFLERLPRDLFCLTIAVESIGNFSLLRQRFPYLMISELVKSKSIAIVLVDHFRILFVGREVIVPLPY